MLALITICSPRLVGQVVNIFPQYCQCSEYLSYHRKLFGISIITETHKNKSQYLTDTAIPITETELQKLLGTSSEPKTVLCGKNSHVGRPPPPVWEFFRRNAVFFWRCPKTKKIQNSKICFLAPQDDFGMQKKLGKQT